MFFPLIFGTFYYLSKEHFTHSLITPSYCFILQNTLKVVSTGKVFLNLHSCFVTCRCAPSPPRSSVPTGLILVLELFAYVSLSHRIWTLFEDRISTCWILSSSTALFMVNIINIGWMSKTNFTFVWEHMLKWTKSILLFGVFADGALYCVGHKSTYSSLPDDYNWYVLKPNWKKKESLSSIWNDCFISCFGIFCFLFWLFFL